MAITDIIPGDTIYQRIIDFSPKLIISIIILIVSYIIIKILNITIDRIFQKTNFERTLEIFIHKTVVGLSWVIVILVILSNLGIDISGIIAGLGIMGFVVGFALKDTLGNLAAGFFLLAYRPFKVDDFVEVADISGTVQEIGLAACRLKSPDGIKITVPNSEIWGKAIKNKSGNRIRTIFDLNIGIGYEDDINKAIKIVNSILKKDKRILTDPEPKVVVKELGNSSVVIAVRPSMKREDYWNVYFDLNYKIKTEFDKNKISIPYPQMDVHVKDMAVKKSKK